ncbi:hypothetical protein [Novosphingobium sp. Leaf2]|uniref:hypothetical protein n=1 Tax=Novosphingobium sp. Leaf2 TaxID=1735670 RepID=UPI0006F881C5|nr:hypothetical protein [Novosphingobium sp. Leaf2]KQM19048.1 hypothetical protein ASE49_08030 [Novosphingobium sp. Leaf2]
MAGLPVDTTLIQPLKDDLPERVIKVAQPANATVQPDAPSMLGEAYRSYIDDPSRAWTANTREAYETSRRLAIAVIGGATPVAAVSRAHCRDLLDVLRFLPANAGKLFPKLFPKLSPSEAAEHAHLRGDIKIISAANANSLMSNMCSFLNWAVNGELLTRNPARGLRLPDPINKRDKRLPFDRDQLHAIFNAPLYRGCADGNRGYNKTGNQGPRNARFWVPPIPCDITRWQLHFLADVACQKISVAARRQCRFATSCGGIIWLRVLPVEIYVALFVRDFRSKR